MKDKKMKPSNTIEYTGRTFGLVAYILNNNEGKSILSEIKQKAKQEGKTCRARGRHTNRVQFAQSYVNENRASTIKWAKHLLKQDISLKDAEYFAVYIH